MIRSLRHRTGLVLVLALLGLVVLGGASHALAHDTDPGGWSDGPIVNPVAGLRPAAVSAATQTPNLFSVTGQGFTSRWAAWQRRYQV
jgi:hypothetical protein